MQFFFFFFLNSPALLWTHEIHEYRDANFFLQQMSLRKWHLSVLVRLRENSGQNNSEYGHFSRSVKHVKQTFSFYKEDKMNNKIVFK